MTDAAIKVLLVEDNPVDARLAAALLGADGEFQLIHVERLSEATRQLSEQHFDAVLLDLMLPDSSGMATIGGVQERAPEVPIVVYSGFGDEDIMFACEAIRGGAQEFLPKSLATPVAMQRAIIELIERKRQEQRKIRFARHDELTGLANHLLLEERFERAASRADRQGRYLALLSIELDHYLNTVEEMGSEFGDRLLRAVAKRLQGHLRKSDTLARFHPRSFTALLEALVPTQHVGMLAAKMRTVMAPEFRIDHSEVFLTASVGIALYPIHGRRLPELLDAASAAMFEVAVAGGDGCRVAEPQAPVRALVEAGDDRQAVSP